MSYVAIGGAIVGLALVIFLASRWLARQPQGQTAQRLTKPDNALQTLTTLARR